MFVGQKVKITGGSKWASMGPWTVIKMNPTKVKLDNGRGSILNSPYSLVQPLDDQSGPDPTMTRPEGLRVGAVVTVDKALAEYPAGTPFVMTKDGALVSIVPLGGDERGRYWNLPAFRLAVVDFGSFKA